jgi:hypothetical protein
MRTHEAIEMDKRWRVGSSKGEFEFKRLGQEAEMKVKV